MISEEMEHRVYSLESNHQSFVFELRQTSATLLKIEQAIEKQNEISTDIRLLRQEFKSRSEMDIESIKRQNVRIEKIENTISRLNWLVILAVLSALLATVIKGAVQ